MPDTDPALGLPEPFTVRGFEGSLGEYVEWLEWQYRAMVHTPGISLWGKPLSAWGVITKDGRDELFWHLITTGRAHEGRKLDLKRCANLPLVWDLLERLGAGDPRACWWCDTRRRIMVAPLDFTFLVVLRDRPECFYLETAYPVGRRHRARLMGQASSSWLTGRSRRDAYRHVAWRQRSQGWRAPAAGHPCEGV